MQSSENQNRARTFPSHCSWLCPLFSQWIITKCPLPASLETSMFTGTAQENMTCGFFFFFLKHGLGWGRCGKRRKKQIYNLISASAKCYEKKNQAPKEGAVASRPAVPTQKVLSTDTRPSSYQWHMTRLLMTNTRLKSPYSNISNSWHE